MQNIDLPFFRNTIVWTIKLSCHPKVILVIGQRSSPFTGKQEEVQSYSDGARKGTSFSWTSVCGKGCSETSPPEWVSILTSRWWTLVRKGWGETSVVGRSLLDAAAIPPPHQHKVRTHLSHTDTRTPRASLVAKRWHGEPMNSSPGEVNYGLGLPRCRTSPSSPQTPYVYKAEMFPGAPSVSVCCAVIFTVNHRFFSGTIFNWEGHGNLMGWCTCCGSENLMPLPGSFIACFHLCSTFDYP